MTRRVAEGCLTVEMEAAAFFAVARFRGVSFGQILYAGDSLAGEAWTPEPGWTTAQAATSCSGLPPRPSCASR